MTRGAEARHWLVALAAAMLLHAVLLAGLRDALDRSPAGARERGPAAGVRLRLGGRLAPEPVAPLPEETSSAEVPVPAVEPTRAVPVPLPVPVEKPEAAPTRPATLAEPIPAPAPQIAEVRPTSTAETSTDRAEPSIDALTATAATPLALEAGAADDAAAESPQATAGSAARVATGSAEDGIEDYGRLLVSQVQSCLRYPRRARRRGISGAAQVAMQIGTDGTLESASLKQTSGSSLLDRDAVETVERCSPFPPPPPGRVASSHRFVIPVDYELEELR